MRQVASIIGALVLSVAVAALATAAPGKGLPISTGDSGPGLGLLGLNDPRRVHGEYIVVLKPGANAQGMASMATNMHGGHIFARYNTALNGFAVRMHEAAAQALANNPNVAYVEVNKTVSLVDTQSPVTWGLDRVDQRNLPLDNSYTFNFDGTGVHAYIIDTGIRATHNNFGGRASLDFTSINDGNGANDCNGHGTHVAGTTGSRTYGVAKNVRLHAVRVLGCNGSGTTAGVIAGVNWVAANQQSPAVANMSLGGGASNALDSAVNSAVASGVFFAVAAGNENQSACNVSPARAANAYTVAATDRNDNRAFFSNFGSCVDIFAPGVGITSTWANSDSSTNTISGTSMASPHVAGAAALLLDQNPFLSPANVATTLTNNATPGVVSGTNGSPNLLLFTL